MEIVSGFLIWLLADVLGIRWVRKESNEAVRIIKIISLLLVSFIAVVVSFMIFGYSA